MVASGYLALTAASTLALVSPVSGVSGAPGPPWPWPPRPPGRPPAWSACTAVASNDASTRTTSYLPSDVLSGAWYGVLYGPPASVRRTVAPGTLASAAAFTLAAASADSGSPRGRGGVAGEPRLAVSAAPAIAAPPRPNAPRAATVIAVLRTVVTMWCPSWTGGCG